MSVRFHGPSFLAVGISLVGVVAVGCSWNRFTELKSDTPVVRLEPAESYSGAFGVSVAVAENSKTVQLYVGGNAYAHGGLVYTLGVDEEPQPNPTDESHCAASQGLDRCSAAAQPVGLNRAVSGSTEHELCFVSGYGTVDGDEGLWTRCDDNYQFTYPVPMDVRAGLDASRGDGPPRNLRLAANRGEDALLVASTSAQRRVWFYEPLGDEPIDIPTPTDAGEDFGAAIAVGKIADGHLVLVAAPSNGEVWLFRIEGDVPTEIGCLGGEEGLGRQLASGEVDGDGAQDFVIAGSGVVTVHSGKEWAELGPSTGGGACADSAIDEELLTTLSCTSTDDTTGCGASRFGDALAVADTDGDGEGEIFVGAPHMSVRDLSRGGAVLAYDGDGDFLQAQIVSDVEEKDLFGVSLASARQGSRDIVIAGAAGAREVYLLYCAGKSDGKGSSRCE